MKQLRLPLFTSKIKIYNLRIVPTSPVFEDIENFKKQFENLFGKQPLSGSKPHITITTFRMNSKYQDDLIEAFGKLSHNKKFKLDIGSFSVVENSNTLYLKVHRMQDIELIQRNVQNLHDNNFKGKLESFFISDNPYITVSKATGKKMLYESLAYFQKTAYSKEIQVGHLTLVSRSKYKTWDWEYQIKLS